MHVLLIFWYVKKIKKLKMFRLKFEKFFLKESSGTDSTAMDDNGFSKGQLDNLYFYYTQSEATEDPVGAIIDIYKRTCNVAKTRLSVSSISKFL